MSSLTRLSLANRLVVRAVVGVHRRRRDRVRRGPAAGTAPLDPAAERVDRGDLRRGVPDIRREGGDGSAGGCREGGTGVDTVTSTSSSGVSRLTVGWAYGRDAQKLIQDLRSAVAAVNASLPSGVAVETYAGSTDDLPALQLAVTSAGDPAELGEQMRRTLVPAVKAVVAGVRDVTLTGSTRTVSS